jgi:acyl-CoA synthetase (NDP forming)
MPKMGEGEARKILNKAGIPLVRECIAKTEKQALACARKLEYPVAMKVSSRDIIHKTDHGLVRTDIRYPHEAGKAFREIMASARKHYPRAGIDGIIVQPCLEGYEAVVGGGRDPQFGPFIMFGLGGIWVEAMKDVSFRVCPVSRGHAMEMVKEIRGYRLLKGFRGKPAGDIKALVSVILRASRLMLKNPGIREMDINPLFVRPRGVTAVDFRIMV